MHHLTIWGYSLPSCAKHSGFATVCHSPGNPYLQDVPAIGSGYALFPILNCSHKIWRIDELELHRLVFYENLGNTKYRYWKGINEATMYFQQEGNRFRWPVNYPPLAERPWDRNGDIRALKPDRHPMLELNRIAKALWEFDKSLRCFIRCAIRYRATNEEAEHDHFWVETPMYDAHFARVLRLFIYYRTRIRTEYLDGFGNCPAVPHETSLGLRFNLLSQRARVRDFPAQEDSVLSIWHWMYGCHLTQNHTAASPQHFIRQMFERGEIANPTRVSYKFPYACSDFSSLHEWDHSPYIRPGEGDELGDLGQL